MVSARGGGPQGLPFNEVNPSYEADQDIWGRTLDTEDLHGLVGGLEHDFLFSLYIHTVGIIIPIDFHIFQRV